MILQGRGGVYSICILRGNSIKYFIVLKPGLLATGTMEASENDPLQPKHMSLLDIFQTVQCIEGVSELLHLISHFTEPAPQRLINCRVLVTASEPLGVLLFLLEVRNASVWRWQSSQSESGTRR